MDRRNFLTLLSSGAAGLALKQVIPFGRVWSFPSTIQIAKRCFDRDGFETDDGVFISTHVLRHSVVNSRSGLVEIGDLISIKGIPGTFRVDATSHDGFTLRGYRL